MFRHLLVLLVWTVLGARAALNGAPTFAGCLNSHYIAFHGGAVDQSGIAGATSSLANCGNTCFNEGYIQAAYQPDSSCYCFSSKVDIEDYASGTDNACTSTTFQYIITKSTFAVQESYPGGIGSEGYDKSSEVTGVEACFQYCEAYTYAGYTVSGQCCFTCYCSNPGFTHSGDRGNYMADGTGFTVFSHTANTEVGASGWVKRRLRERLEEAKQVALQRKAHCPSGLTACLVPGATGTESFECVDVANELESCGGCLHGYFNNAEYANATIGTDCSAMSGVALGGVTCTKGQCAVSTCKRGFQLGGDGTCQAV